MQADYKLTIFLLLSSSKIWHKFKLDVIHALYFLHHLLHYVCLYGNTKERNKNWKELSVIQEEILFICNAPIHIHWGISPSLVTGQSPVEDSFSVVFSQTATSWLSLLIQALFHLWVAAALALLLIRLWSWIKITSLFSHFLYDIRLLLRKGISALMVAVYSSHFMIHFFSLYMCKYIPFMFNLCAHLRWSSHSCEICS